MGKYFGFHGKQLALTLIVVGVGLNLVDNVMAGSSGSTTGGPIFGSAGFLGPVDQAIGFNVMGVHVSPGGELALLGVAYWLYCHFAY